MRFAFVCLVVCWISLVVACTTPIDTVEEPTCEAECPAEAPIRCPVMVPEAYDTIAVCLEYGGAPCPREAGECPFEHLCRTYPPTNAEYVSTYFCDGDEVELWCCK